MTHEDYVRLADTMRANKPSHLQKTDPNDTREAWQVWGEIVDALAETLERDNPSFDRDWFFKACEGVRS